MKKAEIIIFIFFIALLMLGCNPVKRVLRDPVKTRAIADTLTRRGFCVNDTLITTVTRDTVIYQEKIVHDIVYTTLPGECNLDRTVHDHRLVIRDGKVEIYCKQKKEQRLTTVATTNNIRDKRFEALLKEDVAKARQELTVVNEELRSTQNDLRTRTLYFLGLCALSALLLYGHVRVFLRRFLPFLP